MRRWAWTPLFIVAGCFGDPRDGQAFSSGSEGEDSSSGPTSADEDSTESTTQEGESGGPCMSDDECGGDSPICDTDGTCVACTELGIGGCENRDPMLPACDPGSGACVQCNDGQQSLCGGTTPVCVNNSCSPCTANSQCDSDTCLFDTGECLAVAVDIEGTVFSLTENIGDPVDVDQVSAPNVTPLPLDNSVGADGAYALRDIPPFTLVDVEAYRPQNSPVSVTDSISRTVASLLVGNEETVTLDVPWIPYSELGRLAFECMPDSFTDLADAQGTGTGFSNPFFLQRSTVFGRLVDLEGDPLPELSNLSISVKLDGWSNTHLNENEGSEPDPATVCWLEEGPDGKLHPTTGSLSDTGYFVMFRVRSDAGLGRGLATVNVLGFDPATVNLESSGNVGFVELARNDQDVNRDFERDVYPIFTKEGCVVCHTDGGPKDGMNNTLGIRDGFEADWSLDPDTVYDNLTGPGTTCITATGGDTTLENRICTDDPEDSLVIRRPLAEEPGQDDVHPVDIFPSIENPTVQIILEWIEQGATRGSGVGPVSFVDDIYPIFQIQGCIGCHKDGGPTDGMGGTLGERDGFSADWSLSAAEVYSLMTGPGTTCQSLTPPDTTAENRVCTDAPLDSLFVIRPLVDPPDEDDPHPVVIFPTVDHPQMQLIINWISQGAQDN